MIIGWVIIPSVGFPPARPQGNRAWSIPPGKGIPHLRPPRPASFARSHLSLAGQTATSCPPGARPSAILLALSGDGRGRAVADLDFWKADGTTYARVS
jgi:hypothetical protein